MKKKEKDERVAIAINLQRAIETCLSEPPFPILGGGSDSALDFYFVAEHMFKLLGRVILEGSSETNLKRVIKEIKNSVNKK